MDHVSEIRDYKSNLSVEGDLDFAILMTTIITLSLLPNGLCIKIFLDRWKKLHSVEVILLNLSVLNIISSLRTSIVIISALNHEWILNPLGCHLYAAASRFFTTTHAVSLMAIAVVRYLQVSRALMGGNCNSIRSSFTALTIIYIHSAIVAALPLTRYVGRYDLSQYGFYCSLSWTPDNIGDLCYSILVVSTSILFPGIIMVYCYLRISLLVASLRRRSCARKWSVREVWVTKTALCMVLAFIMSWGLLGAGTLYKMFTGKSLTTFKTRLLPSLLSRVSIISTPLIYVIMNRKYRGDLANLKRKLIDDPLEYILSLFRKCKKGVCSQVQDGKEKEQTEEGEQEHQSVLHPGRYVCQKVYFYKPNLRRRVTDPCLKVSYYALEKAVTRKRYSVVAFTSATATFLRPKQTNCDEQKLLEVEV